MNANTFRYATAALSCLTLVGCLSTSSRYTSSSVVDFLYPNDQPVIEATAKPHLELPLRVGIAFTPDDEFRRPDALGESAKRELLGVVARRFEAEEFVERIEVIPSGYLRHRGGFDNVDQIAELFELDVIALVSWNQHRFSDEGLASLAYWTLVGAYIVPGEKNTTHTLMDAVLYDVPSRSLLLRAPGSSTVRGRSTPIAVSQALREDSAEGFELASAEMVGNLNAELDRFKERVRTRQTDVTVSGRAGYRGEGAGAVDGSTLLVILALFAAAAVRRMRDGGRASPLQSSCCR